MIEIPVHDRQGKVLEKIQFDESCLGKFVNYDLLHLAVVRHEANQRQGTQCTKGHRDVTGSTKKPFAQKHTGRARQGFKRRAGSKGGAVPHGPKPRDFSLSMPKQARRMALKSALLGKLRDAEVVVVNELTAAQPKTKEVATTLKNLKLNNGCLVVTSEKSDALWKSVRNIPDTELSVLSDLNVYAVLKRKYLLLTKAALQAIPAEVK